MTIATLKIAKTIRAADCLISVKFCVGKQFSSEFRRWKRYPRSTELISFFVITLNTKQCKARQTSPRLLYRYSLDVVTILFVAFY